MNFLSIVQNHKKNWLVKTFGWYWKIKSKVKKKIACRFIHCSLYFSITDYMTWFRVKITKKSKTNLSRSFCVDLLLFAVTFFSALLEKYVPFTHWTLKTRLWLVYKIYICWPDLVNKEIVLRQRNWINIIVISRRNAFALW